jgi:hypothetical protein
MGASQTFSQQRLTNVETAIHEVELSGTGSIAGTSYSPSDLPFLEAWQRRLSVQVAIEHIEAGAQEYTVLGRTFRRGDLKILYDRLDKERTHEQRLRRGGGMRVRGIVPTG